MRQIGRIVYINEKVSRGTYNEAVIGVGILPIHQLVQLRFLHLALRKALLELEWPYRWILGNEEGSSERRCKTSRVYVSVCAIYQVSQRGRRVYALQFDLSKSKEGRLSPANIVTPEQDLNEEFDSFIGDNSSLKFSLKYIPLPGKE